MAWYKYAQVLQPHSHAVFDQILGPGQATPLSGIYRCEGCGHEATANAGNPLPPQNHHQHSQAQGQIKWRLIVMSTHA